MLLKASISQKEEECLPKWGRNMGRKKGRNHGFRERPSRHWMVVSIQASVSDSICQFLQIYACFDCVVINHQKGGDCKQNGPIRPLFVVLVINNAINGTNVFVK